jgi:hypothetical protein
MGVLGVQATVQHHAAWPASKRGEGGRGSQGQEQGQDLNKVDKTWQTCIRQQSMGVLGVQAAVQHLTEWPASKRGEGGRGSQGQEQGQDLNKVDMADMHQAALSEDPGSEGRGKAPHGTAWRQGKGGGGAKGQGEICIGQTWRWIWLQAFMFPD